MSADSIVRTPINLRFQSVLAIDPGINGTGYALWEKQPKGKTLRPVPSEVGVLRKRFDSYVTTANWIADQLEGYGTANLIVTCEFPEFQTSASRSMGWMRGDLQKLTYLVGVLGRTFRGGSFEPVPVSQWKGQLPKDVVTRRIVQELGTADCERLGIKTHAWDAVGIGLWRLGVFE